MNTQIYKALSFLFFIFMQFHICIQAQPGNACFFNIRSVKETNQAEYFYESCIENRKYLIDDSIRIAITNRTSEITRFDINSEYDNAYFKIFKSILSNMGLMQNFYFFSCSYFNNACATIINTENGVERAIMIDNQFLNVLGDKYHSDYPAISIIAHEIAHHLNNHVLSDISENRYKQEIEADEFSGYILNLIGASLDEALIAVKFYGSTTGSISHPGLTSRIEAIKRGYNNAESKSKLDYDKLSRNQIFDILNKTNNTYSKIIIFKLLEKDEYDPTNMLSIIQTQGIIYSTVNLNRNAIHKFEYALNYAKDNNLAIAKNDIFLNLAECEYEINNYLNSFKYCKLIINDLSAANDVKLQAKIIYLKILLNLKCIKLEQAEKAFFNIFNYNSFQNKESSELLLSAMLKQYKIENKIDSTAVSIIQGNINSDNDFFDLLQHYLNMQNYDACLEGTDFALNNLGTEMDPMYKKYYESIVYGYRANCLYLMDRINEAYDIVVSRMEDIIINQYIADAIKMKIDIVDYNLLR